jgi:hypothetical protein
VHCLDERSRVFYPDWETTALEAVSGMRLFAGQDPSDKALMALVGELATRSNEFRTWWGGHTVRTHSTGTKKIHHPVVGDMTIGYEALAITSTPGLVLMTYLAEPATPSADAMNLLRSWTAQPVSTPQATRQRQANGTCTNRRFSERRSSPHPLNQ